MFFLSLRWKYFFLGSFIIREKCSQLKTAKVLEKTGKMPSAHWGVKLIKARSKCTDSSTAHKLFMLSFPFFHLPFKLFSPYPSLINERSFFDIIIIKNSSQLFEEGRKKKSFGRRNFKYFIFLLRDNNQMKGIRKKSSEAELTQDRVWKKKKKGRGWKRGKKNTATFQTDKHFN